MKNEDLLADIRNKLSPASHIIALVEELINAPDKQNRGQIISYMQEALPKAKESIEYVRQFKL